MLPQIGSVLGVDVGFSPTKRSSAVCRLDWTVDSIAWTIERFRAVDPERQATVARVADRSLLAAAFDGPLACGLEIIGRYRHAERMLTREFWRHIGKPGQSSAPVGRLLNEHANACAKAVLATGQLNKADHAHAIDEAAIVEAFPSSFLGVQIEEPAAVTARRGDRSDVFFEHLDRTGGLGEILSRLLPGRRPARSFGEVVNHDDRAALVCAFSALCVAAGRYVAVGDDDGWIVLPPAALIRPWAMEILRKNAADSNGVGLSLVCNPAPTLANYSQIPQHEHPDRR